MGKQMGVVWAWAMAMLLVFSTAVAMAAPGDVRWEYTSAGGTINGIGSTRVLVDKNGNRILGTTSTSSPESRILISLDREGHFNWQRTSERSILSDMAIDSNNNIAVAEIVSDASLSTLQWHIVSYDDTGNLKWEFFVNSPTYLSFVASPTLITVDHQDNVIFVGGVTTPSGDVAGYLCSISPSGVLNWETTFQDPSAPPGSANTMVAGVAVTSKDDIVVASTEFNGSDFDWVLTSYSPSGTVNWKNRSSSGHHDILSGIAVDSSDNAVVVGVKYQGSSAEWKIASYSPSGGLNWESPVGSMCKWPLLFSEIDVDSHDNVILVDLEPKNSTNHLWHLSSYSSSGTKNWETTQDSPYGSVYPLDIAVDPNDNILVVGMETRNATNTHGMVVCYSPSGGVNWQASLPPPYQYSLSCSVATDRSTGEVVVSNCEMISKTTSNARLIDFEGYPPPAPTPSGHVLVPSEVRTINPAAEIPDPDSGTYLGFGDVVAGGNIFKVEAEFPAYLKESDNSTMAVKIFIAAQMPDDYSRLAYFDSSNNMKFQPPDKLSSWKASVSGEVAKTTVFPEVDVTSALSNIPSGTHYWYTLVVPDTVPDDFSGVDWATTPWEITVNIFDVE